MSRVIFIIMFPTSGRRCTKKSPGDLPGLFFQFFDNSIMFTGSSQSMFCFFSSYCRLAFSPTTAINLSSNSWYGCLLMAASFRALFAPYNFVGNYVVSYNESPVTEVERVPAVAVYTGTVILGALGNGSGYFAAAVYVGGFHNYSPPSALLPAIKLRVS